MICIWSSYATATPSSLAAVKSRMVLLSGAGLLRLCWKERPLNGYSSSNSSRKVDNGPMNKWLNFGGDLDHPLATGIVFRIRHYWDMRKVASSDCAA